LGQNQASAKMKKPPGSNRRAQKVEVAIGVFILIRVLAVILTSRLIAASD
jgi:hypothetical protein